MKLAELGLKTKPETKYFAGGYISFITGNKELSFQIWRVTKTNQSLLFGASVTSKEQLTKLKSIKSIKDVMELVQ